VLETPPSGIWWYGSEADVMTPNTAPANVRTARSSGARPVRLASASVIRCIIRLVSSRIRARISGTVTCSVNASRSCSISSGVNDAATSRSEARSAATVPSDAGWRSNAANSRASMSSWMTTSSLVGKYRKKVEGETSAAAAICSTVVPG
jgi:hypothetical protein